MYKRTKKGLMDASCKHVDPLACWPLVMGMREREAGDPLREGRWLVSAQNRAWKEGWYLMDALIKATEDAE